MERSINVVHYRNSVAARGVTPGNASLAAVLSINVVIANGCRGYELYSGAFKQVCVTFNPCAHNEGIGCGHGGWSKLIRFKVLRHGVRLRQPLYKRNVFIYQNSHSLPPLWQTVSQPHPS